MYMDWREKSRIRESSHKSEDGGFLLEMTGVLSDLLPDSFGLLTTLMLCTTLILFTALLLIWAVRFFVQD